MFYRVILALFVGLIWLSGNAQQNEQRVALVIGNSSYKSSPLKNPVNDARDMSNSLRGYGFKVIERTNLTTRQVGQTLREFRSKLTPGSVAVVFYAGHGVQIKGENYLPTVVAEINGEEDVPMQSLSTRQIMDLLAESKTRVNLVFLDACRDNPYARSFRSASRGIAKENAPSGTLISFATRPGSVAGDGDGRNGLYTSVLLEQIKQSNQPIEQLLKRVVTGVKVASKGQQEPWMEGSIEGDFCFGQCGTIGLTPTIPYLVELSADQKEEKFWNDAFAIGTPTSLEAYLEKYPNGNFSKLAKARLQSYKNQTILETELKNPNTVASRSARYAFVNTEKLFRLLGLNKKPSEKELATVSSQIKAFAEIHNIKLVLQKAVFTSESTDLTSVIYEFYQSKPVDPNIINKLPVLGSLSIAYINTDRFFKNSELSKRSQQRITDEFKFRENELSAISAKFNSDYDQKKRSFQEDLDKRKKEEFAKVLATANQIIKEISHSEGIDLVLQEAVYIAPEFDITNKVIAASK